MHVYLERNINGLFDYWCMLIWSSSISWIQPTFVLKCSFAMNHTWWTHFHASSQKTGILKDADTPFVPTVTAVASAPDLKWMVLSTDISSVSPCRHEKPQSSSHSTDAKPPRKTFTGRRKGVKDQVKHVFYLFNFFITSKLSYIFDMSLMHGFLENSTFNWL